MLEDQDVVAAIKEVVISDVEAWINGFGKIRDKDGNIIDITPNHLQQQIIDALLWCIENNQPCRLWILKPRQKGSTTISVAVGYHMARGAGKSGLVIGEQYSQVENAWDILKTYDQYDEFSWPYYSKVINNKARFGSGGKILQETAEDKNAGRSGTYQFMLYTEVGLWKTKGKAEAKKVYAGLSKCMADTPGTVAIMDSTSGGPGGLYYDIGQSAVPLSERKEGKRGNGFIKIFSAWFHFPEATVLEDQMAKGEEDEIWETLDTEEKWLMAECNCTINQLAWRRRAIASECAGDVLQFDRDYPASMRHAFRAGGDCRFDRLGLDACEKSAKVWAKKARYGNLEASTEARNSPVLYIGTDGDAGDIELYEEPQNGLEYILSADTMRGASRSMGEDPDRMAVFVIRAGYIGKESGWNPPALAARIKPPCIWDVDITAETIHLLSRYYGECTIAIEENNDAGVIEYLKAEGANLFRQRTRNRRTQKLVETYGFRTNESSREFLLAALTKAIRTYDEPQGGFDIRSLHAIDECRTFVKNERGKYEAMEGCHDDDVIALGIGIACIEKATKYVRKRYVHDPLAEEIERMRVKNGRARDRTYS